MTKILFLVDHDEGVAGQQDLIGLGGRDHVVPADNRNDAGPGQGPAVGLPQGLADVDRR